ncbi:hypothetical protein BDP27DRAFT_1445238 [Rhodocollybia butyracea]|uniref:Uncharacterized protein n=1 Tax=Rhodocollybia butyracea TaxID=206335 RepID=A0A9P5Q1Q6_9AGAR|nr:hypothetical protein BDP27DRAFT_1445238 [Rhodocollybia butyracea]
MAPSKPNLATADTSSKISKASELKEEGNQLFRNQDYALAAKKYAEALEAGGENENASTLYSNRAACWLKLNSCVSFQVSAPAPYSNCKLFYKATKLDPFFAKAFGRRAMALDGLGQPSESVKAWEEFLTKLPSDNLTPAEKMQKSVSYTEAVKKYLDLDGIKDDDLPWMAAEKMLPALVLQGPQPRTRSVVNVLGEELCEKETPPSCLSPPCHAWILAKAYDYLQEGLDALKVYSAPDSPPFKEDSASPLKLLSNSILADYRVWHIQDSDYLDDFRKQAVREVKVHDVFDEDVCPETIKSIVQKRLAGAKDEAARLEEWNTIRPALEATIRFWTMEGFHQGMLLQNHTAETEYIHQVMGLITWGREQWEDHPQEILGEIFGGPYLCAVRGMRLQRLFERFELSKDSETRELIHEEAEDLLLESADEAYGFAEDDDPAIATACSFNIVGHGIRLRAAYSEWKSTESGSTHSWRGAMFFYGRASDFFAQDDAHHLCEFFLSYP